MMSAQINAPATSHNAPGLGQGRISPVPIASSQKSQEQYELLIDRLRHAMQYSEAARLMTEDALRLIEQARKDENGA